MLDKKSLGTSGGSLIHVAWNEYGPPAARAFIGVWQRVVNYWIVNRGYSIGIGDTIADPSPHPNPNPHPNTPPQPQPSPNPPTPTPTPLTLTRRHHRRRQDHG